MATGKKAKPKGAEEPEKKARSPQTPRAAGPPKARAASNTPTPSTGDRGEDRIAEFLKLSAREMASRLWEHPEAWLDMPNPWFSGRKPNDLIGTEEEHKVHTLLAAASLGLR